MANAPGLTTRRIGLAALFAANLVFNYAAPQIVYAWSKTESSRNWPAVLLGALLGQLTFITSYDVWGPGRANQRAWKSWLLMLLAWYSMTSGVVATKDSFEIGSLEQFLAVVVTGACLTLAVGHWIAKLFRRGQWYLAGSSPPVNELLGRQFGVRDLLAWTTAAAIVCGVATAARGRELWSKPWKVSLFDLGTIWAGVGMISALSLIVSLPAIWCVLDDDVSERRRFAWVARIAGVVACKMAIVMFAFHSQNSSRDTVSALLSVNLGLLACTAATSWALRALGYRIRWRTPRANSS